MSQSLARVRAALQAADLHTDIREMPGETRTAVQPAAAVGCDLDQIAKSIVLRGEVTGQIRLFPTAGGRQVDAGLASALAGEPLGRADAALVRAETGFAIGGVAPLGHLRPLIPFMDRRLMEFPVVWAAGGTPRHVFALAPSDLARVTGAVIAAFAV